jgi:predicted DsbA family dithiol-disulfide isomerase
VWVDQAAKQLGVSARWLPFELHPDTPPSGADKPFTDAQWPAVRDRLLQLAERVGLPINPPRRNVNSRLALETGELVRARAGDDATAAFYRAVSKAFFVDDADIADMDVIAKHAAAFGVDRAAVESAWNGHTYAPAIRASMQASAVAGVTGVPAFGWPGTRATSGMMEADRIVAILQTRRPEA